MSDPDTTSPEGRPRTETRTVEVTDPALSPATRQILTEEARRAVAADSVEVPIDRPHPAEDDHLAVEGQAPKLGPVARLAVVAGTLCAVAGVVGLIAGGGAWWAVPLAFGFVAVAALLVISGVLGLTRLSGHASAAATAAMTADGVPNPEEFFSAIVDEYTPAPTDGSDEHLTEAAHENPAEATKEQQSAMTPASQPSEAVGPS